MTAPTEDLIARLERKRRYGPECGLMPEQLPRPTLVNPDGPAAAQALRALQNRVEELKDALVEADLTIRSMPGTDQSHVEFIRSALTGSAQG